MSNKNKNSSKLKKMASNTPQETSKDPPNEASAVKPSNNLDIHIPQVSLQTHKSDTDIKVTRKISRLPETEDDIEESEAFKRIRNIYDKTVQMQQEAKAKNNEIKEQFAALRNRLNNSTEFLDKTKQNLEKIKFTYQHELLELNNRPNLDKLDEFITNYNTDTSNIGKTMEEVDEKLNTFNEILNEERKARKAQASSFEQSINDAVETLESISSGNYMKKTK